MPSSHSTESEVSDENDWLDVEPDEESITITSLLDEQTFPTVNAMLDYCKQKHGFDFAACLQRLSLDFHGAVKLVNYIRSQVKHGQPLPKEISLNDFDDDRYLQPVLEDDSLIFSLDEILEAESQGPSDADLKGSSAEALLAQKRELEAELEKVQTQFANYRLQVEQTLDKRWGDDAVPGPSKEAEKKDPSASYFEGYAYHDIHETMLKDVVRTDAYRDFIYENKHIFKDKVVLDIGCGTGILSMFCAKAGAKQVIAVDKSDIIEKARENVFNNGLSNTITLLHGAMEDVKLPVDQVDIIVSEWMGYCLLYEAMLPSVLYARDKYLKPDGIIAPSSCSLWVAPVADPEYIADHISYWRDVYGFDMKAMQENIYDEVRVEDMPKSTLCGEPYPFKVLDLYTIKTSDLVFTSSWTSKLTPEADVVDGFIIWFDNFFANSRKEPVPRADATPETWAHKSQGGVAFTTGPFNMVTHWKQGLLVAKPDTSPSPVKLPCTLTGEITFAIDEDNARGLRLDVSWSRSDGGSRKQSWRLK